MTRLLKAATAATALFLMGTAADAAQAQTKAALNADDTRAGLPAAGKKSLQWNDKGRWGLNFDVEQPVGRDAKLKDMEAGAFFRVAPSVKVGGAVRLGDKALAPEKDTPRERGAPRVRLETKFRF